MNCGQQTGREAEAQSLGSGDGGRADCTVDKADAAATERGGSGVGHATCVLRARRAAENGGGVDVRCGGMDLSVLSGM